MFRTVSRDLSHSFTQLRLAAVVCEIIFVDGRSVGLRFCVGLAVIFFELWPSLLQQIYGEKALICLELVDHSVRNTLRRTLLTRLEKKHFQCENLIRIRGRRESLYYRMATETKTINTGNGLQRKDGDCAPNIIEKYRTIVLDSWKCHEVLCRFLTMLFCKYTDLSSCIWFQLVSSKLIFYYVKAKRL